jgi:predicted RNA binding protein YcfA (HicA-like mRNA interferase family)
VKAVSGREMCKILERKGWRLDRIKGSHHIYMSPDGRSAIPVPVHGNRTLPTGTQHGIMRQAGLSEQDL